MEQKWKISKAQKRQRNARTKEEASVSTHALVAHTRRRVCFYVFLLVLLILSLKNRIIILFHLLSLSLSHSHLFSTTWTRFSSRDHPRFLCISLSLSLSLFLSLSFSLSLSSYFVVHWSLFCSSTTFSINLHFRLNCPSSALSPSMGISTKTLPFPSFIRTRTPSQHM